MKSFIFLSDAIFTRNTRPPNYERTPTTGFQGGNGGLGIRADPPLKLPHIRGGNSPAQTVADASAGRQVSRRKKLPRLFFWGGRARDAGRSREPAVFSRP